MGAKANQLTDYELCRLLGWTGQLPLVAQNSFLLITLFIPSYAYLSRSHQLRPTNDGDYEIESVLFLKKI